VENREVVDDSSGGRYVTLLRHRTIPSPNNEVYTLPLPTVLNVDFNVNLMLKWFGNTK